MSMLLQRQNGGSSAPLFWPGALYPSQRESSAAQLAQLDASPGNHRDVSRLVFDLNTTLIMKVQNSDSVRTILSLRAMSSSSSFFLHSKWASISDCSSIRSLFWRFFWMSCQMQLGEGGLQGWGFWIKTVLGSQRVKPATQWTVPGPLDLLTDTQRGCCTVKSQWCNCLVQKYISLKIMWRDLNFTFQSMLFHVYEAQIVQLVFETWTMIKIQWRCERFLWSGRETETLWQRKPKGPELNVRIIRPLQNRGFVSHNFIQIGLNVQTGKIRTWENGKRLRIFKNC